MEIDCQLYTLGYRIIDGDVGLPHNSFTTSDFMPHGKYFFLSINICLTRMKFLRYNDIPFLCFRIFLYLFE